MIVSWVYGVYKTYSEKKQYNELIAAAFSEGETEIPKLFERLSYPIKIDDKVVVFNGNDSEIVFLSRCSPSEGFRCGQYDPDQPQYSSKYRTDAFKIIARSKVSSKYFTVVYCPKIDIENKSFSYSRCSEPGALSESAIAFQLTNLGEKDLLSTLGISVKTF